MYRLFSARQHRHAQHGQRGRTLRALTLAALLAGCGMQLPAEKKHYEGYWQAEGMQLWISADGNVSYLRSSPSGSTLINAWLIRFEGNGFLVGAGPINTTFVVNQPPHRNGDVWRMTVDGVELTRKPFPVPNPFRGKR